MKNRILLIVLSIALLSSCEKVRQRVIEGTIIDKEAKQPVSNTAFSVYVVISGKGLYGTDEMKEYSFATDENGNFSAMFEATSKNSIGIGDPNRSLGRDTMHYSINIGKKDLKINAGIIEVDKK